MSKSSRCVRCRVARLALVASRAVVLIGAIAVVDGAALASDDRPESPPTAIAGMAPGRSPSAESLARVERLIDAARAATDDQQRSARFDEAFHAWLEIGATQSLLDYLAADVGYYRLLGAIADGRSDAMMMLMAHAELTLRAGRGADGRPDPSTAEMLKSLGARTSDQDRAVWQESIEQLHALVRRGAGGDAEAQYEMALSIVDDPAFAHRITEKRLWFEAAAAQGHAAAMSQLGLACHGRGEFVDAVRWFRGAAEGGDPLGMHGLAVCLEVGAGVERDAAAATRWLRKAAEAGLPQAQLRLAFRISNGEIEDPDPDAAGMWMRRAAEGGMIDAQLHLAYEYLLGVDPTGAKRDPKKAAHWFRAAAEQGSNQARVVLGEILWRGEDLPRDDAEAFRLFLEAARTGDPEGIFWVSRAFGEGRGVARNTEEEMRLLHIAADAEYPEAQFKLAWHYMTGQGVPQDQARGRALAEAAAANGHERAQQFLRNSESGQGAR